ncbi:MAG: PHP domain-containing protein, partial [Pseudorhodobacter sp.]|nr:PHP domain-containing protein [Pseudorhodobacter sp.]
MPLIDLHLHSHYSDGEDDPHTLLRLAIEKKISIFSITDHNFIVPKDEKFSKKVALNGIKFVQGVEISSFDDKTKSSFHILGYSKNFDTYKMNYILKKTVAGYNNRAKKIIKKLNKKYLGLNLNFHDLKKKK